MKALFYFNNYLASINTANQGINFYLFLLIVAVLMLALFGCMKLTKRYKVYSREIKKEESRKEEKTPVQA